MKARITCTVPTIHQIYSISHISRGQYVHNADGSFSWSEDFPTMSHARDYLRQRAYDYAYDRAEMNEMREQITRYNSLTIDCATAIIESI